MVGFIHQSAVKNSMSTYTPHLQYHHSEARLGSNGTSAMELFCRNSQRVKVVGYFRRSAPSYIFDKIFDRILYAALPNNVLQLKEGLWRRFPPLELHKGILDSPCLLILLIYTSKEQNSSTTQVDKANTSSAATEKSHNIRYTYP